MRISRILSALVIMVASASCILVVEDDPILTVINDSSFIIEEIRLAGPGDVRFGRDLTGLDALFPGEAIDIELDCDEYDVFFQDEFGTECVLVGIDVCFNGAVFRITNALVNFCNFSLGP